MIDPLFKGFEHTGSFGTGFGALIRSPIAAGASVHEAIRSPQFVGLSAACPISSFGVFVPFVHLVPYALDRHVDQSAAVRLRGVIGIGSTLGRFFLESLADRIGRQSFLLMMFVGMAGALAIWVFATSFWPLAVFALLFGLFYGGWVAILPAVVTDHFGGRNVGSIIGFLYTSVAIGTLVGPSAAGFIFDMSHSYTLPILASVAANATIVAAFATKMAAKIDLES